MIKIYILSDTNKHFSEAVKEYEKRLWKSVNIIKLKPSKKKEPSLIIKEEALLLKSKLEKEKGYKIYLDILWKNLDTISLNDLIESKKQTYSDIIFIIGWAYGIWDEDIWHIDFLLSFSPMTFPHSMAYLMLLEQIYRCEMIQKWTWYHH